jgi:hypothetical protein
MRSPQPAPCSSRRRNLRLRASLQRRRRTCQAKRQVKLQYSRRQLQDRLRVRHPAKRRAKIKRRRRRIQHPRPRNNQDYFDHELRAMRFAEKTPAAGESLLEHSFQSRGFHADPRQRFPSSSRLAVQSSRVVFRETTGTAERVRAVPQITDSKWPDDSHPGCPWDFSRFPRTGYLFVPTSPRFRSGTKEAHHSKGSWQ